MRDLKCSQAKISCDAAFVGRKVRGDEENLLVIHTILVAPGFSLGSEHAIAPRLKPGATVEFQVVQIT